MRRRSKERVGPVGRQEEEEEESGMKPTTTTKRRGWIEGKEMEGKRFRVWLRVERAWREVERPCA
jgi:hypothetical protein